MFFSAQQPLIHFLAHKQCHDIAPWKDNEEHEDPRRSVIWNTNLVLGIQYIFYVSFNRNQVYCRARAFVALACAATKRFRQRVAPLLVRAVHSGIEFSVSALLASVSA